MGENLKNITNQPQKSGYLEYFILYHYRLYSDDVPIQFIKQVQDEFKNANQDKALSQFHSLYMDMFYMDQYIFRQKHFLLESEDIVKQRFIEKINQSIDLIGYSTYLICKVTLSFYMSECFGNFAILFSEDE